MTSGKTKSPSVSGTVPRRPPKLARLRLPFGYIAILGAFIVNHMNGGELWWWALALVVCGSLMRIWSAGALTKISVLATNGPYAVCRNPLYLGTCLASFGLALFVGSIELALVVIVTFGVAYRSQILWEEDLLLEEHGDAFAEYMKQVPRFFPTRWSSDIFKGAFSWSRLLSNKEIGYQVFWLVMLLGLWSQAYWLKQGISFTRP